MQLSDKVFMITDAGSATGKALARRASAEGAKLVLNYRPGDMEKSCGAAIEKNGCACLVTHADLADGTEASIAVDEAVKRFGRIDVLAFNSGSFFRGSMEDCPEEEFDRSLEENIKSAFIATQVVGKAMACRRSGKVVYVGSVHADKPTGCAFLYSAANGALKNLAVEAALQLGEYGIDVNFIETGPLEGQEMLLENGLSSFYEGYKYKIPSCRIGTADDLAGLAVYLASDGCRYVNGAVIRMDGGLVLHYIDQRANYRKLRDEAALCE